MLPTPRLPRFHRSAELAAPLVLTERDREILRLVYRHRFLRSSHLTDLIGGSQQQLLRRLQLLYHHGFLERPRAQIDYYHRGGSTPIVYTLGSKGVWLFRRTFASNGWQTYWPEKSSSAGRLFLEHALLVSDTLVALEIACRTSADLCLLPADAIPLSRAPKSTSNPFCWKVSVSQRLRIGLVPDGVFALRSANDPDNPAFFFLEADRGTMPVSRSTLAQSSFQRKLLAYEATWAQNLHRTRFGFHRFRVLTVTTSPARAAHLAEAASQLERGRGLFLFTDLQRFRQNPLEPLLADSSPN